jgi:hypothetical protein
MSPRRATEISDICLLADTKIRPEMIGGGYSASNVYRA